MKALERIGLFRNPCAGSMFVLRRVEGFIWVTQAFAQGNPGSPLTLFVRGCLDQVCMLPEHPTANKAGCKIDGFLHAQKRCHRQARQARSLDGCTPFYYAYRAGDQAEIMQLLHSRGARPDLRRVFRSKISLAGRRAEFVTLPASRCKPACSEHLLPSQPPVKA